MTPQFILFLIILFSIGAFVLGHEYIGWVAIGVAAGFALVWLVLGIIAVAAILWVIHKVMHG